MAEKDPQTEALEQREEQRMCLIQEHREALAPVVESLRAIGYDISSLDELRRSGEKYESAVPVLLHWLPRVCSPDAKESIVRAPSVPWAKPVAGSVLLTEFDNAPKDAVSLRWAIGKCIRSGCSPRLTGLIEIVTNKANGKVREMFVLALAKIRQPRSIETLISLLNDDQVAGHAVMALRKAKAPEAMDCLEPFTRHPQSWVRNEAKKAIANIMKAHPPKLGA